LFFGPKPLVAQKAYHAEYSMPSGCDSASAQENQHFAFGNKHKSEAHRIAACLVTLDLIP
jgi:hypothetical protein